MTGYLVDPRHNDVTDKGINGRHSAIHFEDIKQGDTIYIQVDGREAAYYSLQLQLIKKQEKQEYEKKDTQKGKGFNEIIIIEDIPYEFVIPAKSKVVYQMHVKETNFIIDMNALLPLELCLTENLELPPFAPNCEDK